MRPLLILVCCCHACPLAPGPGDLPDERCRALNALFDEVIVSRFDHRLLMLEDYELAQASELRTAAEVECAAGSHVFGIDMIETALREIGVVPPMTDQTDGHD